MSEDSIIKERMMAIDSLKGKLIQMRKRIDKILKDIDNLGASANFSINEDLLDMSKSIWKNCHSLYWLRKFEEFRKVAD